MKVRNVRMAMYNASDSTKLQTTSQHTSINGPENDLAAWPLSSIIVTCLLVVLVGTCVVVCFVMSTLEKREENSQYNLQPLSGDNNATKIYVL